METIYNVDYFIKKFSAIPESKWCTNEFMHDGACCAQGHCGVTNLTRDIVWTYEIDMVPEGLKEAKCLVNMFATSINPTRIGTINNGFDDNYPQPTPKQRVLAALYDLKAKEQPEIKTEKTVYVTVDSEVRVLQKKELSLN